MNKGCNVKIPAGRDGECVWEQLDPTSPAYFAFFYCSDCIINHNRGTMPHIGTLLNDIECGEGVVFGMEFGTLRTETREM